MALDQDLLDFPEVRKESGKQRSMLLIVFSVLQMLAIIAGFIGSMDEIESIIYTGPVLLGLAFATLLTAIIKRRKLGIIHGVAGILCVGFIFSVIFFFEMSPSEAKGPVPWLILASSTVVIPTGVVLIIWELRKQKDESPIPDEALN